MKKIIIILFIVINTCAFYGNNLFTRGEQARKLGKLSLARKYYFKFFTRNPDSTLAPVAMYRYALSNVSYKNAILYLKTILKKYPNYSGKAAILDKMAMLHYLKDKYVECIRVLDDLIKMNRATKKQKLRAYYYIGKSYFMINRLTRSKFFFNKVLSSGNSPYYLLSFLEIGEIYYKSKKYLKAKAVYEKIIKKHPESEAELKAVFRLGDIYRRLSDYVKAKAAYNYIIQSYPMSIEASFAKKKLKNLRGSSPNSIRNSTQEEQTASRSEDSQPDENENSETLTQRENRVRLFLHLGNYRNPGYARMLLRKLKATGFKKAFIKKRKIRNRTYYTLRVGSYNDKSKAKNKARRIKKLLRLRVSIIGRT